jgi:hypothetical protein
MADNLVSALRSQFPSIKGSIKIQGQRLHVTRTHFCHQTQIYLLALWFLPAVSTTETTNSSIERPCFLLSILSPIFLSQSKRKKKEHAAYNYLDRLIGRRGHCQHSLDGSIR